MSLRRRMWALIVALLVALSYSTAAQAPKPTNEFCPILHDKKALPEHWSDYKGRRIYFCCEECKKTFDANPEAVKLPPLPASAATPAGHVHGPGYAEWVALVGDGKAAAPGDSSRPELITIGILSLISIALVAARVRSAPRGGWREALSLFVILSLWTVPWAWVWRKSQERVALLQGQIDRLKPLAKEQALSLIHYATFIEYGTPPRPRHSPLGPRLSATYYRGNDERNPALFNRGNYRTATFNLSVRDEKGERKAGDVLTGPVFISLEIVRAPFTPDYFFSKERLATIFLTADAAPDAGARSAPRDRTALEETEPAKRWRANYALGPITASTGGIIYVREQFTEGARFHYALQYDLQIENGRLGKKSDLFMGALYRTRALTLDVLPAAEWFSHLPIPEKPSAGTTDSKLLGIDTDKRPYRR